MKRCVAHASVPLVLGSLLLLALPRAARAHAPFPAPVAVLEAGDDVVVGLNVGLLVKPPDSADWGLTCSADGAGDVLGYRADPAASERVLALLHGGVAITEDLGCTWTQRPITGQLLDAGFAPGDRIWALVFDEELYQASLLLWPRTEPSAVRQTAPLPQQLEIDNALLAGGAEDGRFWVAGYDSASGTAVLLDTAAQGDEGWTQHPVAEGSHERPRLVYASADSDELVMRLMGSDDERLAFTSAGDSFRFSPLLGGFVRAFFRDDAVGYLVGLRSGESDQLVRLDRDGMPTQSATAPFALRQLAGKPEELLALSYELNGLPLLFQSNDRGVTWSPALRLTDVRGQRVCATVPVGCELGCMQLANLGLVSYAACTGAEVPALDPPRAAPDAAPNPIEPSSERGAGCNATAAHDASGPGWISACIALWLGRRRQNKTPLAG